MNAKVLNAGRLMKKLAAPPAAAKREIRPALEKSADEIVQLAKNLVPVDQGDLRNSIGWTWGAAPKGAIAIGTVAGAGAGAEMTITVFAGNDEAFYARFVEFGTQQASARPFFFPAYRALRKRSKSRIRRAGTKAAKKVAAS